MAGKATTQVLFFFFHLAREQQMGTRTAIDDGEQKQKAATKWLWSVLVIICVAISCGYGSQLKYSILNDSQEHFNPPFTLMWFNNCCLLICFPIYLLCEKASTHNSLVHIWGSSTRIFSRDGFKIGHFLGKELFFLSLYTVMNYCYALSLGKISSSAALTIHSFEVSVVYLLSRWVLHEQFFLLKTIAVFLAVGGVILIALDHEFAADFLGVLFVVLASLVSSTYKVGFKRMAGNASLGQGMLFLSGMGLVNLFANAVPAALLLYFHVEPFEWAFVPWDNLLRWIALTLVYNVTTIFGVALLGPLVISIGILCGIPISIGIDVLFRDRRPTPAFIVGTVCLVLSVFMVTFHEQMRRLACRRRSGSWEVTAGEREEGETTKADSTTTVPQQMA